MSVIRHQRMICFDDEASRFQMRAAGIALRHGHVLVQRAISDDFWALPGGRIEQSETSSDTLLREMQEELHTEVEVGALGFVVESFFEYAGRSYHEIGLYHAMALPESFPFVRDEVCYRVRDGGADLEFRWVDASEAALAASDFYPIPLRPYVATPPAALVHIVDREAPR